LSQFHITAEAFAAHSKTSQHTIARRLQKQALKKHNTLAPKDRNKSNYGGGNLQLTGPNKTKPFLNNSEVFGSSNTEHTEQQIINWAEKLIEAQKQGSIAHIDLVLYTFRAPCNICSPSLKEGIWAQQLADAAGISVTNVRISVWTQNNKTGSPVEPWPF